MPPGSVTRTPAVTPVPESARRGVESRQPTMKLIVNVDGGARGNPGPAAIGVVIRDGEGNVLEDLGETIGEATNNVAEYKALIRGIERARELGADELDLRGDSELVVKQMLGQYKVKHPDMKPLHARGEGSPRRERHPGRSLMSGANRTQKPTRWSIRRSTLPPEPPGEEAPTRIEPV